MLKDKKKKELHRQVALVIILWAALFAYVRLHFIKIATLTECVCEEDKEKGTFA